LVEDLTDLSVVATGAENEKEEEVLGEGGTSTDDVEDHLDVATDDENPSELSAESLIDMVERKLKLVEDSEKGTNIDINIENDDSRDDIATVSSTTTTTTTATATTKTPTTTDESTKLSLTDDERLALYDKALNFKRLGNINHALLCFLDCLRGLEPGSNSKFTMLPQCLTHIAQLYAEHEDFQKAVEFMLAAKLYYEIAIIETGVQVDEYQKETDSGYRPLDLDPCLDEAKRANEYEKLSYSCLEKEKFQLALDYCGKATKLRQQVYGDEHPVTGKTVDLFTLIYAEMGKSQYSEALKKHDELEQQMEEDAHKPEKSEQKDDTVREEKELTPTMTMVDSPPTSGTKPERRVHFSDEVLMKGSNDSSSSNSGNRSDDTKNNNNIDINNNKSISSDNSSSDSPVEEERETLITPQQFLLIFIFSALVSILLTWFWCWMFESESCPSRHYIKRTLKYFYYYYLVPHKYE